MANERISAERFWSPRRPGSEFAGEPGFESSGRYFPGDSLAAATIYRKASCACGGGCPSCQSESNDLKVSQPNDPAEIEADQIADSVMRMPVGGTGVSMSGVTSKANNGMASNTIRRKCDACDDEEEKIHRKPLPSGGVTPSHGPEHVKRAIAAGGRPLDPVTRSFFETRLGYDLSSVRIHANSKAAESANAVGARAYTLGRDIVFGNGEYRPDVNSGKLLLAHELAHVAQNNKDTLHRRLKVDARRSEYPTTAISMIEPLITALCPDFETNSRTGEITARSGTPCRIPRFREVASGSHKLGCCCLCTMTRQFGAYWKIIVTSENAPTTDEDNHTVRMTPTSGPNAPELRHWTTGPAETTARLLPAEGLGHELCGHAALMKIRAHPGEVGDRSYTDEHDPTVNVQNALAAEMHLGGPRRGLAEGGTHRGESLRLFTVGPFNSDSDDPAPFSAQIGAAIAFLNGQPDLLVDTVGFRRTAETNAGISARRAGRVRSLVLAGLKAPTTSVETTPAGPEVLPRVQPATDGGTGGSAVVELRMAVRPAGLITPIGAAPPAVPVRVDPTHRERVRALRRGSVNECHQLLARTAWPRFV